MSRTAPRLIPSLVASLVLGLPAFSQGLILSEVVDATLPGGLPKFVEVTNCGSTTEDLTLYSVGIFPGGSTTLTTNATVLTGFLAPGDSYVISFESGDGPGVGTFFTTYGFDPDNFAPTTFFNGDDAIVLFEGAALAGEPGDGSVTPVQDVYGVVGTDGTGEVWEYTDGFAFRNPGCTPGAFDPVQWTFGGANSLEDPGGDPAELLLIQANTSPGIHFTAVPAQPFALLLLLALGLAGAGAQLVSRRQRS